MNRMNQRVVPRRNQSTGWVQVLPARGGSISVGRDRPKPEISWDQAVSCGTRPAACTVGWVAIGFASGARTATLARANCCARLISSGSPEASHTHIASRASGSLRSRVLISMFSPNWRFSEKWIRVAMRKRVVASKTIPRGCMHVRAARVQTPPPITGGAWPARLNASSEVRLLS